MNDKYESHPSYGMIGVSHVSSSGTRLVGSEFRHHHFVTLKISRASRRRDLSKEWWHASLPPLIEVEMSEAQYIELMARPNMGDGVPCTIRHISGEGMPEPPEDPTLQDKYRADFKEHAQDCAKDLSEALVGLEAAIESGKIGKTVLRDIAKKIEYAKAAITDGLPFVEKQFAEQMEAVTNHAKAEIEATVTQMAIRLGVETMRQLGETAPKLIEGGKEPR